MTTTLAQEITAKVSRVLSENTDTLVAHYINTHPDVDPARIKIVYKHHGTSIDIYVTTKNEDEP